MTAASAKDLTPTSGVHPGARRGRFRQYPRTMLRLINFGIHLGTLATLGWLYARTLSGLNMP